MENTNKPGLPPDPPPQPSSGRPHATHNWIPVIIFGLATNRATLARVVDMSASPNPEHAAAGATNKTHMDCTRAPAGLS